MLLPLAQAEPQLLRQQQAGPQVQRLSCPMLLKQAQAVQVQGQGQQQQRAQLPQLHMLLQQAQQGQAQAQQVQAQVRGQAGRGGCGLLRTCTRWGWSSARCSRASGPGTATCPTRLSCELF